MLRYDADEADGGRDMDTDSIMSNTSGGSGGLLSGPPDRSPGAIIDFLYTDTDSHLNELAELYSYNEELDFAANRTAFEELMEDYGFPLKWTHATVAQKFRSIERFAEGVEVTDRPTRVRAIRAILYLAQGNFADCLVIEDQPKYSRVNVFQLYDYGLFPVFVQLIHFEIDAALKMDPACVGAPPTGSISSAPNDPNSCLKLLVSIVYIFVLEMSREVEGDTAAMASLRARFKEELMQPIAGELIHLTLFEIVIKLCNSTHGSKFPMKKILLLLWKILLLTLGGSDDLRNLKNYYRERAGLKPVPDDTLEVTRRIRPASPPPTAVEMIDSAHQRKINRPFKRQTVVKQSSFGEEGAGGGNGNSAYNAMIAGTENGEDDMLNDDAFENGNGNGNGERKEMINNNKGEGPGSPRPGSPIPDELGNVRRSEEAQLKHTFIINNKSLPWIPKVRQKEIDIFLAQVRKKFIGYVLPDTDRTTTAGLPSPILESIEVLKRHLYESLAEAQMKREDDIHRYPLTVCEFDEEAMSSFPETLYKTLLPSLPQYLISLLKLLLASVSSVRAKNEAGGGGGGGGGTPSAAATNVLNDVGVVGVPLQIPAGVSEQAATVLQSIKTKIDLNRHQEIIIKAISAILLLLLKHYKISHIYQFEYIAQQLMFANCIPLVIKFISQEMSEYITAKNTVPVLDFPACVIGEQPELTSDTIELLTETQPYCWRNMFSSINLLRILNKLTKWKNCRIMMLVLFKSAQPLKRSLRIRHAMFQVYALKLLKMQAKFLGRQWRKNNMKTMSAIYQKVRHRLNDDWAFANDVDSKQLYFQTEEFLLQAAINRFHNRRYEKPFPVANINSVTAQALSSSVSANSFKINEGYAPGQQQQGQGQGGASSYPGTPSTPLSAATLFFDVAGNAAALAATHLAPGVTPSMAALAEADLFQPVDNNLQSVLGRPIELTREFKRNYEAWLDREVYRYQINWDELLLGGGGGDAKCARSEEEEVQLEEAEDRDDGTSSSTTTGSGFTSGTSTILRRGSGAMATAASIAL